MVAASRKSRRKLLAGLLALPLFSPVQTRAQLNQDDEVTPENFAQFCKDICPQCAADAPLRQRADTSEWVHDTAVDLPGTIGKRIGHSLCLASNFRNKYKGVVNGQPG